MSQALLMDYFLLWMKETANMGVAMAPWLLIGFAVSGLLHSFMPVGWVRRHLAKEGWGSIVKAALVGTPLPICSCGVIPVARWLRKEGSSRGATTSFLVSTPETGVDSILATLAMMGGLFAGVRPAVAIVSGILAGILVSRFTKDLQVSSAASPCKDDCCSPTADGEMPNTLKVRAKSFGGKLREAMHYGFVELVDDVAKWLFIGLLAGGAISAFVPNDFLAQSGQWGIAGSYFAVLLLGIPLYVCATGSIPIAAALVAKGITPGAALVFLIAGPATNVATMAFVGGTFGRKALVFYLGSIISVAVLAGVLLDIFAPGLVLPHAHHVHGEDVLSILSTLWGAILFILLLPPLLSRLRRFFSSPRKMESTMSTYQIQIPAMTCGNCARHVEKAARSIEGVQNVQVDISTKRVQIEGSFDHATLDAKLTEEGYPPVHQ